MKCKGLKLLEKNWGDYAVLGVLTYKIGICVFSGKQQETILNVFGWKEWNGKR